MPDPSKERVLLTMPGRAGAWVQIYSMLLFALRQPANPISARSIVKAFVDELSRKLVEVGLFSREELATLKDLEARKGGWGSLNRPKRAAGKDGTD